MSASHSSIQGADDPARRHREAWLLGQPPLRRLLDYLEDTATARPPVSPREMVRRWRKANDHYGTLERSEAGIADSIDVQPLPASLRPLARKVGADSRFKAAYDTVPTRWALVELAKLIVPQPHVNLTHTDRLVAALGDMASDQDLFRFCQPLVRESAPVGMRRLDDGRYLFWSPSSDFRFQNAKLMQGRDAGREGVIGPVASMLGLLVGYGSNFLNVIESGRRMILNNGHHRAYALYERGFTHVPCIVQNTTRFDELALVAPKSVRDDPGFYLKAARPPLLKDFFDPLIRLELTVPARSQVVEISFEVKEYEVEDF